MANIVYAGMLYSHMTNEFILYERPIPGSVAQTATTAVIHNNLCRGYPILIKNFIYIHKCHINFRSEVRSKHADILIKLLSNAELCRWIYH